MIDRTQIEQWVHDKVITKAQAKRMLVDVVASSRERSSGRFITAITTIGALLVGIGAVIFMASRWDVIPNPMKVVMLLGSTIVSYYAGYYCSHKDARLPTVGASLIFLGSLLFGATIFLTAQMYQMNLPLQSLCLLWLIGILPSAYVFRSSLVAGVSSLVAGVYMAESIFGWFSSDGALRGNYYALPVFFIAVGMLLFEIGALHYIVSGWESLGRMYRFVGINIVMIFLFTLTFRFGIEMYAWQNLHGEFGTTRWLSIMFGAVCLLTLACAAFRYMKQPVKGVRLLEHILSFALIGAAVVFFMWPPEEVAVSLPAFHSSITLNAPMMQTIYAILFNVLLGAMIMLLFFVGYYREDIVLINSAVVWSCLWIVVRYYDFFWDQFSRTVFFLVGGAMFLLLGIIIEKKRRELKARFTISNGL